MYTRHTVKLIITPRTIHQTRFHDYPTLNQLYEHV